jgi:hypothetical protein
MGGPDFARSSATDEGDDFISPESRTDRRGCERIRRTGCHNLNRRPIEQTARRFVVSQHLLDYQPQFRIGGRSGVEQGRSFCGRLLASRVEQFHYFVPLLGRHRHTTVST